MRQTSFLYKSLSIALIAGMVSAQIPLYAANEIEANPAGTYTPVKPATQAEVPADSVTKSIPNPNSESDSPLSPATEASTPAVAFTGSVQITPSATFTTNSQITLSLQANGGTVEGDGNVDGSVDASDYVMWRKNTGAQNTLANPNLADFDNNGSVGPEDYNAWRSHFGIQNGVTEMGLSEDGTNFTWEAFQVSKNFTLSGTDGLKNIFVKFRDFYGNESNVFLQSIILDTVGPTGSATINAGDTYTNSLTANLTLTGADTGTGVNQMRFSTDDGATWTDWEDFATTKQLQVPANDGTKKILYQLNDHAGFQSEFFDTIILDQTLPTGSVVINNSATHTNTPNVTLALTADDATSGIDQMRFSTDGGTNWTAWEAFAATKNLSLQAPDGNKTVQYELKDHAGNISDPYSDDIILDTMPPVLPNSTVVTLNQDTPTTFELGPITDEDGDHLIYSYETSAPALASQFQVIDSNHLRYTPAAGFVGFGGSIAVQATDGFETSNFSFISFTVKDTTPPTGSVLINNGAAKAYSNPVTLTLTVNDNVNSANQMRFSTDGGTNWTAWEAFAVTKQLPLPAPDGNKTVLYQVQDQAGNISENYSDSIILDTTPPALTSITSFSGYQDVRKVIVLGPTVDQDGDALTYTYTASPTLLNNGLFVQINNQLSYIPNSNFIGSGTILVDGTDGSETGHAVLNLQIKTPQSVSFNDSLAYTFYDGTTLTHSDVIRAKRALNLSNGSGVSIGVVDTGIDFNDTDLIPNIFTNSAEIAGNNIDDDLNGFIDDTHGWDFTTCQTFNTVSPFNCTQTKSRDNNPADEAGHGTHVSGIAAAAINGQGVVGIAPSAKIVPVRVLNGQGSGAFQDIIDGINYAVSIGAKVINMSLGAFLDLPVSSYSNDPTVISFQQAINNAVLGGVIVVVAAGNNSGDVARDLPAALNNVIAVAATDMTDAHASFSNFGSFVDVSAPGVNVVSTWLNNSYVGLSGTSMSSPFVAGLAALIKSQVSSSTEADVLRRLKYSAVDLGTAGFDSLYGWGRVDAFKALTYDYYEDGKIKTEFLEKPDENGFTRLNFDTTGYMTSGAASGSVAGFAGLGASLVNSVTANQTTNVASPTAPSFSPIRGLNPIQFLHYIPLYLNAFESRYTKSKKKNKKEEALEITHEN